MSDRATDTRLRYAEVMGDVYASLEDLCEWLSEAAVQSEGTARCYHVDLVAELRRMKEAASRG